jgi:hypothetical protein
MRWISVLAVALVAATVQAEEPPLPKTCPTSPLEIGLAKAFKTDDSIAIKLMLVNRVPATEARTVPVTKKVLQDGKEATITVNEVVTVQVMNPVGWNQVLLRSTDPTVSFHDIQGKSLAWEKVLTALDKETPVLVSRDPIDPFFLKTMKPETLVIVAPPTVLFYPQAPVVPQPPVAVPPKEKK